MLTWPRPDLIREFCATKVEFKTLESVRIRRREKLSRPYHAAQAEKLIDLPAANDLPKPIFSDLSKDHVTIGQAADLTERQHELVWKAVEALQPWRKGPFRLFGHEIDAEWRSNLKWNRIAATLGNLRGTKILDVGCGNGYYMFRAAAGDPEAIIGLDPSIPFYLSFELMQRYLQNEKLQYELMGVEDLEVFDQAFDIALCMGIVYHHRSPIPILNRLLKTLRVGGTAIIESQTIPGEGSMALFPEERYAKARNVYFMPTKDCLINWAKRAGFKEIELIDHSKVTTEEQRSTHLMAYESLSDFLDPNDENLTVEGYPAPYRTVIKAVRKFL
ncbi:MAG: tRNA 5-methoxyuridine(34)/uridine 5-oxyacetic acid(34) synthase CmoB [Planctomycetota bacterium]